jgi:1-deoxy-D-xylulose-5-phosphate reductoisomerase
LNNSLNTPIKKKIAILGSTGSIGIQALDVIRQHKDAFEVEVITANNNHELLIKQAKEFKPNAVVIGNDKYYHDIKNALSSENIKVFAGGDSISQIVEIESIDIVLVALVGFSGLKPTMAAINAGKTIALANKETIVVAGEIIIPLSHEKRAAIIPVDSEHSAIFQCLTGESNASIEKIILTASGGPFRGKDLSYLKNVKPENALAHPNWDMGNKISIDSSSLMNKGLEVIEAKWLFGVKSQQIDVVIHPQSIIHSAVQFTDGSIKAQMGLPDMKLPILFALSYPQRLNTEFKRFSFIDYPELSFEKPDTNIFRNLALAYEAINNGGNMPCILNASNEIAVDAFLKGKAGFLDIPLIIEKCMKEVSFVKKPSYEVLLNTDKETRIKAEEFINQT